MRVYKYADKLQVESLSRMPLQWGYEKETLHPDLAAIAEKQQAIFEEIARPPSQRKRQVWSSHLKRVLTDLVRLADKGVKTILEHTPVVEILLADLNAHAVKDPENDDALIIYSVHTPAVLGQLNLLATPGQSSKSIAKISLEVVIRCARAASVGLDKTFVEDLNFVYTLPNYREQMNIVMHMQCLFILAHELGHHCRGHLDLNNISKGRILPGLSLSVDYLNRNQTQELEADVFACQILASAQRELPGDWRYIGTYAVDLLFSLLELVDALRPKTFFHGPPTHPSASLRRTRMRILMDAGPEQKNAGLVQALVRKLCTAIKKKELFD